jgi:PhnB protein
MTLENLPQLRGQLRRSLPQTFFAARFAMLRDRFGTSWMLLAR